MAVQAPAAEAELTGALARALEQVKPSRSGLGRVGGRVRLRVEGGQSPCVLVLDQRQVGIDESGERAEMELVLTPDQALALARGRLPLAAALEVGAISASGPVRRFLEVEPIIRDRLGGPRARGAIAPIPDPPTDTVPGVLTLAPDHLAVEATDLHTNIRGHQTLAGATLRIPEGVISVLMGPTGAGKSVLLDHLIGLKFPDHGEVIIRGRRLGEMRQSELRDLRLEIAVMFADGAPFSSMTLFDNVAFSLRQHTDLNEAEIAEVVLARLGDVGLTRAAQQLPGELSPGMRRRAGLAGALAQERSLLICDEPDFGLNAPGARRVADLLLAHHAEVGGTVIVVTRNLELAAAIADHVAVIDAGRVVASQMLAAPQPSENVYVRQLRELAAEQRAAT